MEELGGTSNRHWRHLIPGGTLENNNHRGDNSPMGWGGAGLGIVPVEMGGGGEGGHNPARVCPMAAVGTGRCGWGSHCRWEGHEETHDPTGERLPSLSPTNTNRRGEAAAGRDWGSSGAGAISATMGRGCISRRRLPSLARHETGWLHNPSTWTSRRQRLATQPLQSGVASP